MLDYLYRLGWIDIIGPSDEIEDDDTVAVTNLGRAVLNSLDEGSLEEALPAAIVLDQNDPIARARVISEIAGLGPCALVDRYFSADELLAVLQRTEIARVLTGPDPRKRIAGLEQALADVRRRRSFEIRISDKFHDRFVISDDGDVRQIGTSLGGISRRLSVMVTMNQDAAAAAIRRSFESGWDEAEPLEPKAPAVAPDAATRKAAKDIELGEVDDDSTEPSSEQAT